MKLSDVQSNEMKVHNRRIVLIRGTVLGPCHNDHRKNGIFLYDQVYLHLLYRRRWKTGVRCTNFRYIQGRYIMDVGIQAAHHLWYVLQNKKNIIWEGYLR